MTDYRDFPTELVDLDLGWRFCIGQRVQKTGSVQIYPEISLEDSFQWASNEDI